MCPSTYLFSVHCTWRSGNPEDLREFLEGDGEQCASLSSTALHLCWTFVIMGLRSGIPTSTGAAGQVCVLWPADIIWLARQFLLHLQSYPLLCSSVVGSRSPCMSLGRQSTSCLMPAPQHHLSSTAASGTPFSFLTFGFLVCGMGVQPHVACCLSH